MSQSAFVLHKPSCNVLIGRAGRTEFNQKLLNSRAVNAGDVHFGAKRVYLNQIGNHFDLLFSKRGNIVIMLSK